MESNNGQIKKFLLGHWELIIFSAALMLASSLPVFLTYINPHEGFTPSGISIYGSGDLPVYFSYISQIKHGQILVKDLHTLEPEQRGTLNILWLVPGLLARYSGLSPQAAFHITRIFLMPFLVAACHALVSIFLKNKREKFLAMALVLFGSGVGGWLAPLWQGATWSRDGKLDFPMDLSVPEFSVFGSALQSPHLVASWACFASLAYFLIRAFKDKEMKFAAYAGITGLVFFNFHPYYASFFAAFALLSAILYGAENKSFRGPIITCAIYLALSSPSVFYHFWLMMSDPAVLARAAQNRTLTPPLLTTLISFGLFIPLAIFGLRGWKKNIQLKILLFWALLQFVFLYIPWPIQRRFSEGLILPLSILAATRLASLWSKYRILLARIFPSKFAQSFLAGYLLFLGFGFSNYIVYSGRLKETAELKPPAYLDKNFVSALDALKLASGNQVLAGMAEGNFIPYWSGKRVYAGHWAETIYYEQKDLAIKKFFGADSGSGFRKNFLQSNNIDIVFAGPKAKGFEISWPAYADSLKKIYGHGGYTVYSVLNKKIPQ